MACVFALVDTYVRHGDGKLCIDDLRALNLVYSEVADLKKDLGISGESSITGKSYSTSLRNSPRLSVLSKIIQYH